MALIKHLRSRYANDRVFHPLSDESSCRAPKFPVALTSMEEEWAKMKGEKEAGCESCWRWLFERDVQRSLDEEDVDEEEAVRGHRFYAKAFGARRCA